MTAMNFPAAPNDGDVFGKWEYSAAQSAWIISEGAITLDQSTTDDLAEGVTNLYYTKARVDSDIQGQLLDEDDMVSDDATKAPTQQSVKAYVGSQLDSLEGTMITGIVAGNGLTGDATSGTATLAIGAGAGISVTADAIAVSGLTTTEFAAATIVTDGEGLTSSDNNTSLPTTAAVVDYVTTNFGGDITGVTAGTGLTGGGTTGTVTLNVAGLTTAELSAATLVTAADTVASNDNDTTIPTTAAVIDYVNATGDINNVIAGTGLTGGGTSGAVTLNVAGLTTAELSAATLVTEADAIGSNDNDTTIPTSAAVLDHVAGASVASAATLTTARNINGTAFDGSANITTANWGTARNISIGGTTKSVNGSTTYTWTTTEIGITKANIDALNIAAATATTATNLAAATAVTEAEGIASNDNDTTHPTSAAVKDYVDTAIAGAGGYSDASVDTHLNTGTATAGQILSWTGTDYDWINNATGTVTSVGVTAGVGLSGGGTVTTSGTIALALDFAELTDMTASISGTTEFILQNGTTESRKAANEIGLSFFLNDAGFSTTSGTVTSVTAGAGMTQTGTASVNPTLNVISANAGITVNADNIQLNADQRGIITQFGQDTTDYIQVGTTNISFVLDGNVDARLFNTGEFHADGDVVAFSTSISDAKLKDQVETIDDALATVKALRGVEFTWNSGSRKGKRDVGFIAQEVEEVIPNIVHTKQLAVGEWAENPTDAKTVDYDKVVAVLVEAVKELSARVEELESN